MVVKLSSKYLENLEKVLERHREGDYEFVRGNFRCGVCCNRKEGAMLLFVSEDGISRRQEFYHRECLSDLLKPEEYGFIIQTFSRTGLLKCRASIRYN